MVKNLAALKEFVSAGWGSSSIIAMALIVLRYGYLYLNNREERELKRFKFIQDHEYRMSALAQRADLKEIDKEIENVD
ncbi:hypothetical protein [Pseudoalteromonas phenolica]|uniref:hypothetical protein n=1 Tax=Pseudoalteromonas phenolica TaxID=161398 RepID=UPI00384B0366